MNTIKIYKDGVLAIEDNFISSNKEKNGNLILSRSTTDEIIEISLGPKTYELKKYTKFVHIAIVLSYVDDDGKKSEKTIESWKNSFQLKL